uniref:Uncharacterized protein n=1 Tax=Anguilla anguilla TaxID=7936 RepID=A0A0E9QJ01_ANGAN
MYCVDALFMSSLTLMTEMDLCGLVSGL